MIRICHVQVQPLMSGAQRSMLETLRHLDAAEFEPSVVCQSEGPLTDELRARGISYHLVPELERDVRPVADLRAYHALKRWFRHQRIDLVHNQSAKPRVVALLAARHAGVRVVVNHIRGYSFHEHMPHLKRLAYQRFEAWAAARSDVTLFVNHEEREFALANDLVPAATCRTIYNGADLGDLSPQQAKARRGDLRCRFGWGPDEVIVLVLGRLDHQKQPLIVPQIARRLEGLQLNRPWRIAMVGDGPLRPELEEAIGQHGLWHRIQLVDWQDSPADALHAGDLVLLPSLWEGLPRALIEAHAAGLPCVASNIRGNREVVGESTGFLIEAHSVAGYASALTQLIENPLMRAQFGRAARSRAEECFDSHSNNAAIIRLYYELLRIPMPQKQREAA